MADPKPATAAAVFPEGTILAGRFRVEGTLGRGGMATVARVTDLATGRSLALKLLRPELTGRADIVERFRREGALLAALKHPTIVEIETFGKLDDGTMFLAMELLEGETLGARLRKGPMSPRELTPIVAAVCAGLDAAHARGIVHRDLKPENLFLQTDPDASAGPPRVKILDFGIAKTLGSDRLTDTGEMLGTPRYMAPEQLTGESDLDARVDVYAMGAILYEALAGRPAFLEQSPSDLIIAILQGKSTPLRAACPHLPDDLVAVITRAMAKPREGRFASIRELGEAFIEAAGGITEGRSRADLITARLGSSEPEAPRTRLGMAIDVPGSPLPSARELLVPGTFSMPAVEVDIAIATPIPPPVIEATPQVRTSAATPFERTPISAVDRRASNSPFDIMPATPAHATDPSGLLPGHLSEDVIPGMPPVRRSRALWVIVVALVAGGLTAVAVITALRFLDRSPRAFSPPRPSSPLSPPRPPPPPIQPQAVPVPAARIDAPMPDGGFFDAGETSSRAAPDATPSIPTSNPSTAEDSAMTPTPRPTKHLPISHRRESPALPSTTSAPLPPCVTEPAPAQEGPPAAPQTLPELLSAARRALAHNDAAQCLAFLDRANELGAPASALHLRGDCLRRAGRNDEAVAAYKRFCRLAPDHPTIGDVRGYLESLGQTCP